MKLNILNKKIQILITQQISCEKSNQDESDNKEI